MCGTIRNLHGTTERYIMKKFSLYAAALVLFCTAAGAAVAEPQIPDTRNLLVNSRFDFYSLTPHRHGRPMSYVADYVPFWNADTAKSLRVMRDSHIDPKILPPFSTSRYRDKYRWAHISLLPATVSQSQDGVPA